ncbi:MAG: hypothetical protein AAF495_09030 [Pseudomonadota bacterium]
MDSYTALWAATMTVVAIAAFMAAIYWFRQSHKSRLRREFEEFNRFEGSWAKK